VALADLFQDQLDKARDNFNKITTKGYSMWMPRNFRGTKRLHRLPLRRSGRIVIATASRYYHPQHLGAAVAAGKHVVSRKSRWRGCARSMKVMEIGKRAKGS